MQGTWPLIEREQEFRTIQSALNPGGSVCGVVLTGDSGVGKTTLARLVTAGTETGVRWVAGTESARSIPLGVFAHLVGPAVSSDPVTYLSAARETLLAEGDTIIGVDDAHLLDELSATLLHQLAIDRAVQIVATVRSGEAVPDAVTSLWKDNHLIRITLSPFTKEQSVELIESVLGGQLEEHSADRMWEASGGNALFLRHLVEGARAARTLRQVNGVWQLRGRAAITSELASLLAGRVEQLQPDVLAALKYLSLCEPLDIDVLSDLASEEAVEQAEIDGLVRITRDGRSLNVSFHHPLFGEVIRHGLGLASSRRLRGALVRALDSRPKDTPAARIRLADLALESDVGAIDPSLLGSAARDALNLAQVPMGERFARAAIADGGGADEAELLARALMWQAQPDKAEQLLAQYRLADLDEIRATRIGVLRVGNMFWAMGDSKRADELLDEVRARVTEPLLTPIVDAIGRRVRFSRTISRVRSSFPTVCSRRRLRCPGQSSGRRSAACSPARYRDAATTSRPLRPRHVTPRRKPMGCCAFRRASARYSRSRSPAASTTLRSQHSGTPRSPTPRSTSVGRWRENSLPLST